MEKIVYMKTDISEIYSSRIMNNINDSFYVANISWEGRIKSLRTYAEIIVRFILNIPEEHLLISRKIQELKTISDNNELLMSSVNVICEYGDEYVHTEIVDEATESDFNKMVDAIYGLYAYLFIAFFEKYDYKNNRSLYMFSLLPPIIRYKTFNYLWNNDKENPILIDKLNLSILKTFGYEVAKKWMDDNKNLLMNLPSRSKEYVEEMYEKIGDLSDKLLESGPQNMYEVCIEKLNTLKAPIEKYGPLYNTYEEALSTYNEQMLEIQSRKEFCTEEIELKRIMDFCYQGRKGKVNDKDSARYSLTELRVLTK